MSKLTIFLQLINDDLWHSISELSKALNVPQKSLSEVAKLLMEHNIIEYKSETEEVKISPKWKFICEE